MIGFGKRKTEESAGSYAGLAVSTEELTAQRKYLPYLEKHPDKFTSDKAGEALSAFKGRGMELEEVRAYNFGDDIRDIDWRVTARKSEPYTKVFREEKDREITVFLDFSASMVFGTRGELKSVTAAKFAALAGWFALKNKDRFGIVIYDGNTTTCIKPQNNFAGLMRIFGLISGKSKEILRQNAQKDADSASADILRYARKGSGTVFIVSDFYKADDEYFKRLSVLARGHEVYCVNIFDPLEESAPASGVYAVQSGARRLTFDSSPENFRKLYAGHFSRKRENIRKNCQKFSCRYIEIRTDTPVFRQLPRL